MTLQSGCRVTKNSELSARAEYRRSLETPAGFIVPSMRMCRTETGSWGSGCQYLDGSTGTMRNRLPKKPFCSLATTRRSNEAATSEIGTFLTWRNVRLESVMRIKADIRLRPSPPPLRMHQPDLDAIC